MVADTAPRGLPRSFWLYLGSRFSAATASTLLRSAVAWHVFALTQSAFHLGLVGLVQFVPALTLTLVGGAVADTYDRRRVMQIAQLPAFMAATALAVVTARGAVTPLAVYAAVLTLAVATAFDSPARAAFLPSLVPRDRFPRAVTFASTAQALAFATGPGVGGLVIAAVGVAGAYATAAGLVVVAFVLLGLVRVRERAAARGTMSLRAVREGLAFVRRTPVVLGCMTLDMFAVIFGGASALLPIFADDILGVGPRGYGLLSSSLELGALASALVMTVRSPIERTGRALVAAVAAYGLATIVFGLSRWFALSVAAYALAGMADQVSVVARHTAIQLSAPDDLRGRVSAVNMICIAASNQLGAVESGFVAALTSAPFAVVSGGVGCLVVLATVALLLPELVAYRAATLAGTRPSA
ncbi:MAG: MFS transporter [Candidatus Binatia bacterium]